LGGTASVILWKAILSIFPYGCVGYVLGAMADTAIRISVEQNYRSKIAEKIELQKQRAKSQATDVET
jgi:hypothetical protein